MWASERARWLNPTQHSSSISNSNSEAWVDVDDEFDDDFDDEDDW